MLFENKGIVKIVFKAIYEYDCELWHWNKSYNNCPQFIGC